jgi:hypothetical protein
MRINLLIAVPLLVRGSILQGDPCTVLCELVPECPYSSCIDDICQGLYFQADGLVVAADAGNQPVSCAAARVAATPRRRRAREEGEAVDDMHRSPPALRAMQVDRGEMDEGLPRGSPRHQPQYTTDWTGFDGQEVGTSSTSVNVDVMQEATQVDPSQPGEDGWTEWMSIDHGPRNSPPASISRSDRGEQGMLPPAFPSTTPLRRYPHVNSNPDFRTPESQRSVPRNTLPGAREAVEDDSDLASRLGQVASPLQSVSPIDNTEIITAFTAIARALDTDLTVSVSQFPFVDNARMEGTNFAAIIESLENLIHTHGAEVVQTTFAENSAEIQKVIARFARTVGSMVAIVDNNPQLFGAQPISDLQSTFLGNCVNLLGRLNDTFLLPHAPTGILNILQRELPGVYGAEPVLPGRTGAVDLFTRATTKSHNPLVCKVCNHLGSPTLRPTDIADLGDLIASQMPLLTEPERIRNGDAQHRSTHLAQHWNQYFEALVAAMDEYRLSAQNTALPEAAHLANWFSPESVSRICDSHAEHVFAIVGKRVAAPNGADQPDFESTRTGLLLLANICPNLSDYARTSVIPHLLRHTVILADATVRIPKVNLSQDLTGERYVEEVFNQFRKLTKSSFIHNHPQPLQVRYVQSASIGAGPVLTMISQFAQTIIAAQNGLFLPTFGGSAYAIPNLSALSAVAMGKFRTIGQMIGLALSFGDIVVPLHLSPACIRIIRSVRFARDTALDVALETVDIDELLEIYSRENPGKFRDLNDPATLAGHIGLDFPLIDGRTFDNVEEDQHAYLVDHAKNDLIAAVFPQMMAILSGVYDVVPFPRLAYKETHELEEMFNGATEINLAQLRASASYSTSRRNREVVRVTQAEAEQDQNVIWFWEILSELDQEQLGGFLQFVSGSRFPPLGGFTGPSGTGVWLGVHYNINKPNYIPTAHTCYHEIDLYRYPSKDAFRHRIHQIIGYDVMDDIQ